MAAKRISNHAMNLAIKQNYGLIKGVLLIVALSIVATIITFSLPYPGLSPLITGIILGLAIGNTIKNQIPISWEPGIIFSAKKILRLAIILYGFRVTFQMIASVGPAGLIADVIMLTSTFLIGSFVGIKLFKIDPQTTFLTASGASICGAAAVLATQPIVKADLNKTAMAVATVVMFGTIAMFLYPFLYKIGVFTLDLEIMGIFIGSTVHEVAQVVAVGNALSPETSDTAVIVKMVRVMLIVPVLLFLSLYLSRTISPVEGEKNGVRGKIIVPWFAVYFIAVAGINSLQLIPAQAVLQINVLGTFLLTMAMTALGIETNFTKFREIGGKPVLLALVMFLWLIIGGYYLNRYIGNVFLG